ncbi:uncharacterized protein LOC124454612 [Xenia sp. Carnegie-2017]|uniref:uncharacterized protein LOC124454612 n=1 Tax=Xenia sp. Carnegie-2017 TaxID=2897299 RepID=UPI001F035078|nr:uncharacterized protein LOC124454612 [Xenia sp. Carnegie-2017]
MSKEHMFHVIYVFIICSLFHQLMMQTSKAQNNDKISRLRSFINQKYTTKTNTLHSKKRLSRSTDFSMDYCYKHKVSGKGFKIEKHGLNVTLNCTKDGDWWSAVIKWKKPKSQAGMDDCVGYVVRWQNYEEDDLCAIIDNENITTYTIDSTKEWGQNEEGDDSLYFIVFALPLANVTSVYENRVLNVKKSCLEKKFTTTHDTTYEQSTIISEDLSRTGMTTDKPKMSSEATLSTNVDNNKQLIYRSKKPVVNKVIFSIVMTFVSLLILVIAVVLYHKKKPFSCL